jgi:hypothetical protein
VQRADEAGALPALPERPPQFGHEVGQVRLLDEDVGPQGVLELGLRDRPRPLADEDLQELEGLRRQVEALPAAAQLAGLEVGGEGSKGDAGHDARAKSNPRSFR